MHIDYAKSLTFIFDDEKWLSKVGWATLWAFVSFLLLLFPLYLFICGYGLELARNVTNGKEHPLPELDDINAIYKEGFRFLVVLLVYSLPLLIINCLYVGVAMVPTWLLLSESPEQVADWNAAITGSSLAFQCLVYFLSLGYGFIFPAIMVRFIQTDDIRETLKISEVIKIVRDHFFICFMIMLMSIAATFIWYFALLFSLITICGIFVVYFIGPVWLMAVQGHLVGQFYRQLQDSPAEPDLIVE